MTKKIIYLFGGPGIGKSTIATDIFSLAKRSGVNIELVREYVKDWMWEGREIKHGDQMYFAAKQSRKERICFKDVDMIVSDSPMHLGIFYENKYDPTPCAVEHMVRKHKQIAHDAGFDFVNILLKRSFDRPYNPKGRNQTEEEAIEIDIELKKMMDEIGLNYHSVDSNEDAASLILNTLLG